MPLKAFYDITGRQGRIYLFEDGGLEETLPFELGEDQSVLAGEPPDEIEEACVSLPLEALDFRMLELPMSDPERIREVLPFELDGIILGGAESVVVDAVVVGEAHDGRHTVLAAYMDKAALGQMLRKFSETGIDPRAVTCLELARIIKSSQGKEDLGRMLIEPPAVGDDERPDLALAELERPVINLRRGELAYTRDRERTKRTFKFTAAALVALVLLVSADIGVRTARVNREIAAVEKAILKTYSEMFPGEKPGRAQGLEYKIQARMREARAKDAALRGVASLPFLMKLREAKLPGLAYTDITLDREFVVLKGEAPSLSDVERARTLLEGFLEDVKISETGQSAQEAIAFTITAKEPGR